MHQENYGVYGIEKVWKALQRKRIEIGRDHVARLMAELGIAGLVRGCKTRTTKPAPAAEQPADLVKRNFSASAPNRLWVADLTYVATWAGSPTWLSSSTPTAASSSAGGFPRRCLPTSPSTRSGWRSGPAPGSTWETSSITATGA